MIYAIDKLEEVPEVIIGRLDLNNFEWQLSIIRDGIVLHYQGDPYFMDNIFKCEVNRKFINIRNTNLIKIAAKEYNLGKFDLFLEIENLVATNYTDDIWEHLEKMFTTRLQKNQTLLETEKVVI